jgi:hypothetical protein
MTDNDPPCTIVVGRLVQRLAEEPEERHWSAFASLWGRVFVEARPAWDRWPDQHDALLLSVGEVWAAMARRGGTSGERHAVLAGLRASGDRWPEDDGSDEWGKALAFFEMTELVLDGISAQQCLKKAAQVYLEDVFNTVTRDLARATIGGAVSYAYAEQYVPADRRWGDAVALIETL